MRRQARTRAGGARMVRPASALQVWLWLLIFVFQNEFRISKSIQPGYLDFDNLPETNFTCEGKVIGGYYADLETSCQMFHVCTVGQQDEPMDIKFLCLNGTVFDQETRVCERVDEVDCTKSEKFYSLNLELYGSTIAPPKINQTNLPSQTTQKPQSTEKPHENEENDPSVEDSLVSSHQKPDIHTEYQDSTEDPVQEAKNENTQKPIEIIHPTNVAETGPAHEELSEENQEEEEIDSEVPDYDEDYTQAPHTTTQLPITTSSKPSTTIVLPFDSSPHPTPNTNIISTPSASYSSLSSPTHQAPNVKPTLDPALLTPQEFIYRHRGPGSEAISFQRQGFRPADGVYITHAPQQQFDHFQYESSRTAPRPQQKPQVPFVKRPSPAPFRATTLDPRDQLLRPGSSSQPSSQPSERHETSVKHRPQVYPSALPAQRPLPFDPYYYERKRSDDPGAPEENESTLTARSVGPPILSVNRPVSAPPPKPKSPPRVIVTASASVSDSNGKRLNYTVGNVVSAVKPIVPINYDDYKESDLIFDPFFLDVPKLQKRRKSRGSKINQKVVVKPLVGIISDSVLVITTTPSKVYSQATTNKISTRETAEGKINTTTPRTWNPNDYVDDNYEPQVYDHAIQKLAEDIFEHSSGKEGKGNKPKNENKILSDSKQKIVHKGVKVNVMSMQSSSSQIPPVAAPSLFVQPPCAYADCRNNA